MEEKVVIKPPLPTIWSAMLLFLQLCMLVGGVVVLGYEGSAGDPKILAMMFGATVGLFFVFNYRLLLIATLVGGLLISGLMQLYVPKLELIRWGVACAAMILIGHVIVEALRSNKLRFSIESSILFWVMVFFGVLVLSVFVHDVDGRTAFVSLKGYFQVWGILLAMA